MADEVEDVKVEKKSSPITKIILFGVPAFIVQLILVYFITANILMNKVGAGGNNGHKGEATTEESADGNSGESEDGEGHSSTGQFIYAIDEIIINPANTNGRKFLLTALAFDLATEENRAKLEEKDFLVKDMVISVISSKSTAFLSDVSLRDSLRSEIAHKVEGFLPNVKINKVYFSKWIVQ